MYKRPGTGLHLWQYIVLAFFAWDMKVSTSTAIEASRCAWLLQVHSMLEHRAVVVNMCNRTGNSRHTCTQHASDEANCKISPFLSVLLLGSERKE